ncbi:glycosyltransferase family 2 protein [Mariniflexile sp.]|uniref:glycosyltransferase family 2 protein n=2 Tax=Mariniflexile sp. TaxID=1979402 RepID=UPI0040486EA6
MCKFSILITTKNRLSDLKETLNKQSHLIENDHVEFIVCDDGSTDGTSEYISVNYPEIKLLRNATNRGYIYCRNLLLNQVTTEFAISLDDDAHFITKNPLENIQHYFNTHPTCGLLALRIFWGIEAPKNTFSDHLSHRVRGFVGCGHVWRMAAWRATPNYPEWFVFYGEEEFASFQLFKKNWEVHYNSDILVHHRVDVKARRKDKDYQIRLRRSLRSGWYLYFLFYPWALIPKRFLYTLWIQLKTKVFKGDFKAFLAIIQALVDVVINMPRLMKNANRLSKKEFLEYYKLPETKLYWKPKD